MAAPQLDAMSIRTILREELSGEPFAEAVRTVVRQELAPVEERLTERIIGVEGRLEKVEGGLEAVRNDLAKLRKELVGVIDERFPPMGQQRTGRGTTRGLQMAAKEP